MKARHKKVPSCGPINVIGLCKRAEGLGCNHYSCTGCSSKWVGMCWLGWVYTVEISQNFGGIYIFVDFMSELVWCKIQIYDSIFSIMYAREKKHNAISGMIILIKKTGMRVLDSHL